MLNEANKKLLIKISILAGTFLVIIAILASSIILSRSFYQNGLRQNCQAVLDEVYPKSYKTGQYVDLKSGQNFSAACFKTRNLKNGESDYYAVIVRIPSITGAVPAVYLYSKRTGTIFVSYAIENGKASNVMDANFSSSSILYWQSRIEDMLTKSGALK